MLPTCPWQRQRSPRCHPGRGGHRCEAARCGRDSCPGKEITSRTGRAEPASRDVRSTAASDPAARGPCRGKPPPVNSRRRRRREARGPSPSRTVVPPHKEPLRENKAEGPSSAGAMTSSAAEASKRFGGHGVATWHDDRKYHQAFCPRQRGEARLLRGVASLPRWRTKANQTPKPGSALRGARPGVETSPRESLETFPLSWRWEGSDSNQAAFLVPTLCFLQEKEIYTDRPFPREPPPQARAPCYPRQLFSGCRSHPSPTSRPEFSVKNSTEVSPLG